MSSRLRKRSGPSWMASERKHQLLREPAKQAFTLFLVSVFLATFSHLWDNEPRLCTTCICLYVLSLGQPNPPTPNPFLLLYITTDEIDYAKCSSCVTPWSFVLLLARPNSIYRDECSHMFIVLKGACGQVSIYMACSMYCPVVNFGVICCTTACWSANNNTCCRP